MSETRGRRKVYTDPDGERFIVEEHDGPGRLIATVRHEDGAERSTRTRDLVAIHRVFDIRVDEQGRCFVHIDGGTQVDSGPYDDFVAAVASAAQALLRIRFSVPRDIRVQADEWFKAGQGNRS